MQKLYYNGTILTMEQEGETAEALLTEDNRIIAVGSLADVQKKAEERKAEAGEARLTDLEGRTLMPAFVDAHSHIAATAQTFLAADLSECEDFEDIIQTMQAYIARENITEEGVAFGFGYDQNNLREQSHPGKAVLDQVSEQIPVYVLNSSGHMGCVNSAALQLAAITEATPDPEGGKIGRLPGSREPDGYLEEGAMMAVQKAIGSRLVMDMDRALDRAQDLYLRCGVTTVQEGAGNESMVSMLTEFGKAGKLKLDTNIYLMMNQNGPAVREKYAAWAGGKYRDHVRIAGYKLVLDGSPQGRSAWLTKPYENSGGDCAYAWFSDEEVYAFIKQAIDEGCQLLAHCNGDAAADQYLNQYRRAYEASDNPDKAGLRPVMIHCQTVREDQLDEMKRLDMIPSFFIGHVYYWGEVHLKNLGQKRAERISPVKSALERGLMVNLHQDTPVTKPDMLHSVWCAVNRLTRSGRVLGEAQRVSVYEALKAVTLDAAYAYFEEDRKGSLRPGKLADLVILSEDPMTAAPERLREIQVLETVREGKTLYRKAAGQAEESHVPEPGNV